jgi:hypothetical protein
MLFNSTFLHLALKGETRENCQPPKSQLAEHTNQNILVIYVWIHFLEAGHFS